MSELLHRFECSQCHLVQFYARNQDIEETPDYVRDGPCPHGCKVVGDRVYSSITMSYRGSLDISGVVVRTIAPRDRSDSPRFMPMGYAIEALDAGQAIEINIETGEVRAKREDDA